MNKKIILFIIGSIISVVFSTLMICFVTWKWDFSQMDIMERFLIVISSLGFISLTFIITGSIDYFEKDDF